MELINSTINVADLPSIEKVHLKQVHPNYLRILRYEWMLATSVLIIIAAVLIIFSSEIRASYWWVITILITIIISATYYYIQEKSFPFKRYAVREKDVIYEKGWIIRSTTICPFNRIQNCSVQSGPWERKFKLASLIIYTAGTGGADMRIPGLMQDEAEALRHFILDKISSEVNDAV